MLPFKSILPEAVNRWLDAFVRDMAGFVPDLTPGPGPALLVVSENWLPGWRATVDGETRPVLRANHTLQAVPLEGGSSRVVLEYRPALVFRSAGISLGSLGLALLLLLVGWFRRRVAVPELQG